MRRHGKHLRALERAGHGFATSAVSKLRSSMVHRQLPSASLQPAPYYQSCGKENHHANGKQESGLQRPWTQIGVGQK